MKVKNQDQCGFSIVEVLVVLVVAGAVGFAGWYVYHSQTDKNGVAKNSSSSSNQTDTSKQTSLPEDLYAGWKTYESADKKLTFKYPSDWHTRQDGNLPRVYASNTAGTTTKDNMPTDFQQVWVTTGSDEASVERENSTKIGSPLGASVSGEIVKSTIKSGDLVINTYEFNSAGGKVLQAFWADSTGQRYYATNSSEIGQVNQQNMVDNLKKILATVVVK